MLNSTSLNAVVWGTADKYLRGAVKSQNYGDYIIPFTILRRMECLLEPKREEIAEAVARFPDVEMQKHMIPAQCNVPFYTTSDFTLEKISNTSDDVKENLQSYLDSFSDNVADIWKAFGFNEIIEVLDDANVLWGVIRHFSTIDLKEEDLGENALGDLFEDLMYRSFSEGGQVAGEFYTPREVIHLMVDVLFSSDDEGLHESNTIRSIYDPTAGTGGMLIVGRNAIKALNPEVHVVLAGQEMMRDSLALGKSDLIMVGEDPNSLKHGDTLANDLFAGEKFDYVLSNPPYGTDWDKSAAAVKEEAKIEGSRFSHGLPGTNDGQMLFMTHVIDKLKDVEGDKKGGRAGVVTNGSPLFSGGPGSGPDKIRRWMIENDFIDAIIALPTSIFYNTGIATYVWIFDKNKEPHRKGKIQIIDATNIWTPMRKGKGDKRRYLSDDDKMTIVNAYNAFEESEISKIVTGDDLGFRDLTMAQPKRYAVSITEKTVEDSLSSKQATGTHEALVRSCEGVAWNDLPEHLKTKAKELDLKLTAGLIDHIMKSVAVDDENAPVAVNRKGETVMDKDSQITERIPLSEDIQEHMEREVLPFAPDLIWDKKDAKIGYEIPITRMFYKPEPMPTLEELDAQIEDMLEKIRKGFEEVKKNG